jgi:hypothetical protein
VRYSKKKSNTKLEQDTTAWPRFCIPLTLHQPNLNHHPLPSPLRPCSSSPYPPSPPALRIFATPLGTSVRLPRDMTGWQRGYVACLQFS